MKLREDMPLYASGLAGALALAVSTYNVYLQRAQVRAQVWPHLEWLYSDGEENFTWDVSNTGVGPAIIRSVRLSVDGAPVKSTVEAIEKLAPGLHDLRKTGHVSMGFSSFDQRVMPAGAEVHPVRITSVPEIKPFIEAQAGDRFQYEICYCSTLDDCWSLTRKGSIAVPSCPKSPHFDNQ